MNKQVKRMKYWVLGLVVLALAAMGKTAEAASTDTIILLVTPVVNMSVTISSPSAGTGYDFGGVDLGGTSTAGIPATVTNDGNIASQWSLRSTGLDNWAPGSAVATDQAVLQALFGEADGGYPVDSDFDSVDSTMTQTLRTSQSDVRFSTGPSIMGVSVGPTVNDSRLLWFRIKMPPESNYTPQQRFRVFVVAGSPQ